MKKHKNKKATRPQANRNEVILNIVASDNTFSPYEDGFVGKCIFCGGKLFVDATGKTDASLEHIVPITAGGTNELKNLALAHKECNNEKGRRHDQRYPRDPRAVEVVEKLLARRLERWINNTYSYEN